MPGKKTSKKTDVKNDSSTTTKKGKTTKNSTVETPVVETPVVETPVVETPVVEETTENIVTETDTTEGKVDPIKESLMKQIHKFEEIEKEAKASKVELRRTLKLYEKKSFKRTRKGEQNKANTGFNKPCSISKELCKFLSLPEGSKLPRTDVTRGLNKYIKEHNLQDPEKKKNINADAALTKLLNLKPTDKLDYFTLQTFLVPHFPKEDTSVTV